MADNFEQLSDDALEPMQLDQTSERRTLRKSFLSISSEDLMRRRLIASPKEFSRYPWTSYSRRLTLPIGRMLTGAHVSNKACENSIPFTVQGIANCQGSLFFFNVTLFLICSLASQNILLMSSSVSLVSLKNIHNLWV
ncbi:hypothetical protein F2Q70_00022029 [Brassica cretica]|uniref:Uncharacterized protein n=1 Tax=Brassica cretica TaxID=69181 RepID=A0A8S9GKP6_BRACR|nr:hypothetical protein F2Q70_00022029 [Brassica cretica]